MKILNGCLIGNDTDTNIGGVLVITASLYKPYCLSFISFNFSTEYYHDFVFNYGINSSPVFSILYMTCLILILQNILKLYGAWGKELGIGKANSVLTTFL